MKFDDVLEEIGGFGIYQKYVFALVCFLNLVTGFFMLSPVFLLGIPNYRCAIPGYTNDTYTIQNVEHQALVDQYIPSSEQFEYNRCHVCLTRWNSTGNCTISRAVKCDKWVYDTTVYLSTFVTEVDLVCDREMWVANAQMIFYGGTLLGSVASGVLADRYGRKPVVYVSLLLMTGSSLALPWSNTYWLFCVIEFILGAAIVASFMPAYVISVELTSIKKRVWPGIISNYPYLFGVLVLAAVAYWLRDWFKIQLYTSLPGVLLIGYWWLLPESPRWLLSVGRVKEAEMIIRKAAKWNRADVSEALFDLRSLANEEENTASFIQLFNTKKQLSRSLVIFFNWISLATGYYGLILNSYNLHGDLYLNFGLSGLVEFPAYVLAVGLVDRVGRRRLYCTTMIIGGLSCGSTILSVTYGTTDSGILTILLSLFGRLCVTTAYCVAYIHSMEVFPTTIRNTGLCWAFGFSSIGSMLAPQIVFWGSTLGGTMKDALPLLIIGVMTFSSGIASLTLPETLNKPLKDFIQNNKPSQAMDKENSVLKESLLEER